jgi:hypothetical protein
VSENFNDSRKKFAPTTESERRDVEYLYQQHIEEMKAIIEGHRSEARALFSGEELDDVLKNIDYVEHQTLERSREEWAARNDSHETRPLLEKRKKEFHMERDTIKKLANGPEREEALKRLDDYETELKSQLGELHIYENPPGHFPEQPGFFELMRRQKILKNGSPQEKNDLISRMRRECIESDAHKRKINEKLQRPDYRLETVYSFNSRVRRFNLYSLALIACFITVIFLANRTFYDVLGHNGSKMLFYTTFFACVGLYIYFGKKLYRCPACGFQLDFLSRSRYSKEGRFVFNSSNLSSCSKCGAPFR